MSCRSPLNLLHFYYCFLVFQNICNPLQNLVQSLHTFVHLVVWTTESLFENIHNILIGEFKLLSDISFQKHFFKKKR